MNRFFATALAAIAIIPPRVMSGFRKWSISLTDGVQSPVADGHAADLLLYDLQGRPVGRMGEKPLAAGFYVTSSGDKFAVGR